MYTDPSTGSLIFQAIAALLASIVFYFSSFRNFLKRFFSRRKKKNP